MCHGQDSLCVTDTGRTHGDRAAPVARCTVAHRQCSSPLGRDHDAPGRADPRAPARRTAHLSKGPEGRGELRGRDDGAALLAVWAPPPALRASGMDSGDQGKQQTAQD